MHCPFCSHDDSRVIDSRDSGDETRRRRGCLRCGLRFTTYERVQTRSLLVAKRDGRREEFNRDKLWGSVAKACAKPPLPVGSIERVVEEIEARLADVGRAEIPNKAIGEMVMEWLKDLDRVAYIRFASVYRDFRDIETFKEEIDSLLAPRQSPVAPTNQLSLLPEEPPILPARRRGRGPRRQRPGASP